MALSDGVLLDGSSTFSSPALAAAHQDRTRERLRVREHRPGAAWSRRRSRRAGDGASRRPSLSRSRAAASARPSGGARATILGQRVSGDRASIEFLGRASWPAARRTPSRPIRAPPSRRLPAQAPPRASSSLAEAPPDAPSRARSMSSRLYARAGNAGCSPGARRRRAGSRPERRLRRAGGPRPLDGVESTRCCVLCIWANSQTGHRMVLMRSHARRFFSSAVSHVCCS